MRIGVDATCWYNARGYGRHARSLLTALVRVDPENRYTFFVDRPEHAAALPAGVAVRVVPSGSPAAVAAAANGHRSLRDMVRMSRALSDRSLDLVLFPTVYSFVPVFSRAKKLVIIHDVIAERFPHLTLPGRRSRLFWRAKVALGRRQADAIVTVSNYSRRGIAEQFKLPLERVFVAGEASDETFRVLPPDPTLSTSLKAAGIGERDRLIVYVGGFGPHKNLATLVQAFAGLVAGDHAFGDLRLVLVGEYRNEIFHTEFTALRAQIERLGIAGNVVFTGYLPDDDVVVLLNRAMVLVLPSLMEGFGLPAVEAAACGCPVIATVESPLPELLGDGGLYFDPTQPDELRAALARVVSSESLRQQMRAAGIEAAHRLTWPAAAGQLLDILRQVASAGAQTSGK